MKYFILAAFLISALAAVHLDEDEVIANRHGLYKKEKNLDVNVDVKKLALNKHRHFGRRHAHRFNRFRSHSFSLSKSDSDSFHKKRAFRRNRFARHNKFPKFHRAEKELDVLKVGDAQ